ncbi:hypothetical protein Q8A67_024420 [Cirrhinus molitorella]|uniref:Uncharacterized protein n=1 Tax=Cirrhinus molitorella TaxID=172907 RepID=A0AA88P3G6_9TELE|nr:hypothetical protein Q8A67_024420 [Cirrhinus molitorella]
MTVSRGRQNLTQAERSVVFASSLPEADITLTRSYVEKLGVSQCLRRGNFLHLTARSRRDLQLSQAHTAPSVWITGIRDSKNIIRKAFRKHQHEDSHVRVEIFPDERSRAFSSSSLGSLPDDDSKHGWRSPKWTRTAQELTR